MAQPAEPPAPRKPRAAIPGRPCDAPCGAADSGLDSGRKRRDFCGLCREVHKCELASMARRHRAGGIVVASMQNSNNSAAAVHIRL